MRGIDTLRNHVSGNIYKYTCLRHSARMFKCKLDCCLRFALSCWSPSQMH